MAIIDCKECGGTVSDSAAACPHCGAPVAVAAVSASPDEPKKKRGWWKWVLGVPLGLFALFVAIGLSGGLDPDYKSPVKAALGDSSARFSGVTLYSNGAMCGFVDAKIIPERHDSPSERRRFIVGPSGNAIVDDGTKIGTQIYNQMVSRFCSGPVRRELK